MRRALLVNPPIALEQVYGAYSSGAPVLPPLGFCYVASALLAQGWDVRLYDAVAERATLDDISGVLRDFKPDLLGVTSTTVSFFYAKQAIALAKAFDPRIVTVLGGAHVSALPRETLEEVPELDVGVFGEGENTMTELAQALAAGRAPAGIRGLCYRENGGVVVNAPRPNEPDLDRFRRPARHLLRDLRLYSPNPLRGFGRAVSLVSSRGCTFDCSYCDQSVFSRRWRGHSAGYVLAEIHELRRAYGFDFFSFEDDHFLINKRRVVELCRALIDADLGIGWTCSARANSITPEIAALMRAAGCRIVYVGLESGSPRILEKIDKAISLEAAARGVETLKKSGIMAYGAFMIGTPGETAEDIRLTRDFALSLPLDAVSCFIYVPYPGTPLRQEALALGTVSRDWRDYSAHPTRLPFLNPGFSETQMLELQRDFYRSVYLRPSFVLNHLPQYLNGRVVSRAWRMLKGFCLDRPRLGSKSGAAASALAAVPGQRERVLT